MSTYKLTSSFSRSWFSSPEEAVGALVSYGVDKELVVEDDRIFVTNALLVRRPGGHPCLSAR